MLGEVLEALNDEFEKLAFRGITPKDEVEGFHLSERKDWGRFEKNLRRKGFREAAGSSSLSDEKLKRYVANVGGYLESKDILGLVPSRTSEKKYKIKRLSSGRLACNCKDWQYHHSVRTSDCDHVAAFKSKSREKTSSIDQAVLQGLLTMHRVETLKARGKKKHAARAGARQVLKLISSGNVAAAERLAARPGVFKNTPYGSGLKHLGGGAEGTATLVAHPQHGLSVRKLYNPQGMATDELIRRKEIAGEALRGNPHVAQYHGGAQTPYGGKMHFYEYAHGSQVLGMRGQMEASIRAAKAQTLKGLRRAGFHGGQDIRAGNMVNTSSGPKVIDYIPSNRGEFAGKPLLKRLGIKARENDVVALEKGESLLRDGKNVAPGRLQSHAFRGTALNSANVTPSMSKAPTTPMTANRPTPTMPPTNPMRPPRPSRPAAPLAGGTTPMRAPRAAPRPPNAGTNSLPLLPPL